MTTWRLPSCTSTTTVLALASRLASAPRPPLHGGLVPRGGGELDGSAGFDSESHSNRATWRSTKSTPRSTAGLWGGPPVRSTIAKKPVHGGLSLVGPVIRPLQPLRANSGVRFRERLRLHCCAAACCAAPARVSCARGRWAGGTGARQCAGTDRARGCRAALVLLLLCSRGRLADVHASRRKR